MPIFRQRLRGPFPEASFPDRLRQLSKEIRPGSVRFRLLPMFLPATAGSATAGSATTASFCLRPSQANPRRSKGALPPFPRIRPLSPPVTRMKSVIRSAGVMSLTACALDKVGRVVFQRCPVTALRHLVSTGCAHYCAFFCRVSRALAAALPAFVLSWLRSVSVLHGEAAATAARAGQARRYSAERRE